MDRDRRRREMVFASAGDSCAIGAAEAAQVDEAIGSGCWPLPDNYPPFN